MLNVTEEVGIITTSSATESSKLVSSSLPPTAADSRRTLNTTQHMKLTQKRSQSSPTQQPQTSFRKPAISSYSHGKLAATTTTEASTDEEEWDDPVAGKLKSLHDIATKAKVFRKVGDRMHRQLDDMCLERSAVGGGGGGKMMISLPASTDTGSSPHDSPSTIPTTKSPLSLSPSEIAIAIASTTIGATSTGATAKGKATGTTKNRTNGVSDETASSRSLQNNDDLGGAAEPRSPATTNEAPFSPPHKPRYPRANRHHEEQPPSSILRKGKFSPKTAASPSSRLPSTGQRVRGLWSPSIEVLRDDGDDLRPSAAAATTTATARGAAAAALRGSSPEGRIEAVRDETLARVFCYLPLADLLRAGMVSRRWRHEIHRAHGGGIEGTTTTTTTTTRDYSGQQGSRKLREGTNNANDDRGIRSKGGKIQIAHHRSEHRLWERVDASSFIQETYDKFLDIATKRKLQKEEKEEEQQQQQLEERDQPVSGTSSSSSSATGREEETARSQGKVTSKAQSRTKRADKTAKKSKGKITDPARWASLQTGRALGNVLRSKMTMPPPRAAVRSSSTKSTAPAAARPSAIRSLILRNVGTKLSSDHLDDFLPPSVLSSLRELTLEGFESLTDTHVHVLLLTTTLAAATTTTTKKPRHRRGKNHPGGGGGGTNRLEALALENCRGLTSKVLHSVAKTCGHEHLRRLSVRGCPKIDSIEALSDLLITKLILPPGGDTAGGGASEEAEGKLPSNAAVAEHPAAAASGSERASLPAAAASVLEPSPLSTARARSTGVTAASRQNPMSNPTAVPSKPAGAAGLASWFALPPSREEGGETAARTAKPTAKPGKIATSPFAPPPSRIRDDSSSAPPTAGGLGSLFSPPPPPKNHDLRSKMPPPTGIASLFAPPPQNRRPPCEPKSPELASLVASPPAKRLVAGARRSTSSSSSHSASSLASLFDLPGTSPTRRNNAESIRILPPPSMPIPGSTSSNPHTLQNLPLRSSDGSNPHRSGDGIPSATAAASKRYHRHQRTLSNGGKLPFPPALLPSGSGDADGVDRDGINGKFSTKTAAAARSGTASGDNDDVYAPAIAVGSLGTLDIRGTAVTPSSFVGCLRALTHHSSPAIGATIAPISTEHHRERRLWCKVWFEALHLGGDRSSGAAAATASTIDGPKKGIVLGDREAESPWTSEDLARLETVLDMEDMARISGRSSKTHGAEGISYSAATFRTAAGQQGAFAETRTKRLWFA